jgi:hypothetical protein
MFEYVYTNNEGKLEKIQPFENLRGIHTKGKKMGQAKNEEGTIFNIYPAGCGIGSCYCYATAKEL